MHIPDGFLDTKTWVGAAVTSTAGLAYMTKRVRDELGDENIPLLGVTAAFIFAAQMLNFPVLGGTSGHLLGGFLAVALLGPWAGSLVLAVVLAVQAFVFQDGGLTALGANVLNMALIGTLGAYIVYRAVFALTRGRWIPAAIIASWASVVLAALAAAVELAISGAAPLIVVVPAMLAVHAIIGVGEALITVTVLRTVFAARPDLISGVEVRAHEGT